MTQDSYVEEIPDEDADLSVTRSAAHATASAKSSATTSATTSVTTSATTSATSHATSRSAQENNEEDEIDEFDAASQATRWSAGAKRDKTVPKPGKSMGEARTSGTCLHDAANNYANHVKDNKGMTEEEFRRNLDARTGATPGVASACRDLDMDTVDKVSSRLGIKMPGEL
jgi:hypothetical protein